MQLQFFRRNRSRLGFNVFSHVSNIGSAIVTKTKSEIFRDLLFETENKISRSEMKADEMLRILGLKIEQPPLQRDIRLISWDDEDSMSSLGDSMEGSTNFNLK